MPRHKKGTLVRVRTQAEHEDWKVDGTNDIVTAHGWLFVVEQFIHEMHTKNDSGMKEYHCRSLSTGEVIALYPREITTKQQREMTNDRQQEESNPPA